MLRVHEAPEPEVRNPRGQTIAMAPEIAALEWRKAKEAAVIASALELIVERGGTGFRLLIPNTSPPVYVFVGSDADLPMRPLAEPAAP